MRNPFEFGRELGSGELVDRKPEVAAVVETIANGGKLFLIGPRRYGKTSILKVGGERAEEAGAVVLRYNVEAYPSIDLLVRAILSEATERLVGRVERAGDKIKRFFAALRPEVGYSMTEGTWSASLGVDSSSKESQVPLIVELFDGIERLAADSGKPVGIILDEFQKLIELGGREAEGQLRAAVQRHKHVGYVFAGSKTRMLTDMTGDPARPFYRLGSRRFVGAVPRDEFAAFLRDGFARGKFRTEEEAVEAILDSAEEVPYNVQLLAHTCWTLLGETKEKTLREEHVAQARERVVRQDDPFYTQLWNNLNATQQKALLAVVRERGSGLLSARVTRRYGMPPSTMQRALEALTARDIVREEETQGALRLRLEDPFLGAWVELFAAK